MAISKCFFLFILLDLSTCTSCKEKEWTTLPPETQTGTRTFGCYVNGELFVKGKESLFNPRLFASYYKNNDSLSIVCASDGNGTINMQLSNVEINISKPISEAVFYTPWYLQSNCYCFAGKDIGEIIITKFDTINWIISGLFQFQGQCSDDIFNITGDSIVYVTNGRFDTLLGIFN